MFYVRIPAAEYFDPKTDEFIYTKAQDLQLEHSLVSLSKWESEYKKPYINTRENKTTEETLAYIRCMTLTQNVDPNLYRYIPKEIADSIALYIDSSMTATTFNDDTKGKNSREVITSELIYYWMIALNIPFECQKWHLNRLFTLIRICNIKNSPPKKMSRNDILARNRELNAERRRTLQTKG